MNNVLLYGENCLVYSNKLFIVEQPASIEKGKPRGVRPAIRKTFGGFQGQSKAFSNVYFV